MAESVVRVVKTVVTGSRRTVVYVIHKGRHSDIRTVTHHQHVAGSGVTILSTLGWQSLTDTKIITRYVITSLSSSRSTIQVVQEVIGCCADYRVGWVGVVGRILHLCIVILMCCIENIIYLVGLQADPVANINGRRLNHYYIIDTENQGVDTAEAVARRSVGRECILLTVEGDEDAVEYHLVGTLDREECSRRFGAGIVAIVSDGDETVHVAALGRGAGTDDAVGNSHFRQVYIEGVGERRIVALAIYQYIGDTAKDTAGEEVGIGTCLAPVAGVVDRSLKVDDTFLQRDVARDIAGSDRLHGLSAEGVVYSIAAVVKQVGLVGSHIEVAEGLGPSRAVANGIDTYVDIDRAVDVTLIATAVDALLDTAAGDVHNSRRTQGSVHEGVGSIVHRADALVGIAVVDSLATAIDAEHHVTAVHIQYLLCVGKLLAKLLSIDTIGRIIKEAAAFHIGLATGTGEEVAMELAAVDIHSNSTYIVGTVGIGTGHIGSSHITVANQTHIATAIDGVEEVAAVDVDDHIHSIGNRVSAMGISQC